MQAELAEQIREKEDRKNQQRATLKRQEDVSWCTSHVFWGEKQEQW